MDQETFSYAKERRIVIEHIYYSFVFALDLIWQSLWLLELH